MASEKHSKRIEENEHPKTHLAVLDENLTEYYRGKNKVVAPLGTLNVKDKNPEFTFGKDGVNSFSQGICKKMFNVDDYSGLTSEQIAFVNHLTFMMAKHFNLNMNRVNKGEKFLFNFTGGVAHVIMFDKQGRKVIDNQPIQAGAITKAMEMLGKERLHADARIDELRAANPNRKSLVEMATEWDGLVDTLQVFGERISVEARKEMLQGLDVFDETVDTAIRADIDAINGINKYLKLHFEVEKKLSGSALNAAMEKHRVNLDGTGYADTPGESGPQSVAWVRFIRHDIFKYDVPFTDAQISSAQADLESERSEAAGAGEVRAVVEKSPGVVGDDLISSLSEQVDAGEDLKLSEEMSSLDIQDQVATLAVASEVFALKMKQEYEEFEVQYSSLFNRYEETYHNFMSAVKTDEMLIEGRDEIQSQGDALHGDLLELLEVAQDRFPDYNKIGKFLSDQYASFSDQNSDGQLTAGLKDIKETFQGASAYYDDKRAKLYNLNEFPVVERWELPSVEDLKAQHIVLEETPAKMSEHGLDVNMSVEELDKLKGKIFARITKKIFAKQSEMRDDNPNFEFTFMPSQEGELGSPPLPYIYMDFSLDGITTEWSTSRSGTVDGKRRLAKRFSKKSGVELRNVEEYLAMKNIEEDLASIFEEVDVYMLEHAVAVAQSQVAVSESLDADDDTKTVEAEDVEVKPEVVEVKPKVRPRPRKVAKEVLAQIDFDLVGLRLRDSLGANAQHVESISVNIAKDTFEYDEANRNWVCDVRWVVNFKAISSVHGMIGRIAVPGDEFDPEPINEDMLFDVLKGKIKDVVTRGVVENLAVVNAALDSGGGTEPIETVVTPEGSEKYGGLPKLKRYKVSAIDEIRLPAYADSEFEFAKVLTPKEKLDMAKFESEFGTMRLYARRGQWKPVEEAFKHVESKVNMSLLWSSVVRGRLVDFYWKGAESARAAGDNEEVRRRLTLAAKLAPDNTYITDWLVDLETNYAEVSFGGDSVRASSSPFSPVEIAVIKSASERLADGRRFRGYLPKLREGEYYIVTVNGEEKVLDLHENLE